MFFLIHLPSVYRLGNRDLESIMYTRQTNVNIFEIFLYHVERDDGMYSCY